MWHCRDMGEHSSRTLRSSLSMLSHAVRCKFCLTAFSGMCVEIGILPPANAICVSSAQHFSLEIMNAAGGEGVSMYNSSCPDHPISAYHHLKNASQSST